MSELVPLSGFDDFMSERQPLGIIVKSFSQIGFIAGLNNGKVTITSRELVVIDDNHAIYFVDVEIENPNQHPQTSTAAIPYDEIDRVIAGAHVLSRAGSRGVSRMKKFEASIATADGAVRLVVFNHSNGRIMSAIHAQNGTLFFQDTQKLIEVADQFLQAKQTIDRIRVV
jgi:hypothetical protein